MVKVTKLTPDNAIAELARIAPEANRLYARERREKKKRHESMDQQFRRVLRDLTFAVSRLVAQVDERKKKISEATKAGLARAKRRGVKLGGARRTSNVDTKRVFTLRKKGFTQQEIAMRLGISQPLVSKILRKRRAS
jgi:CRP-like cAMP-binding protein